MLAGRRIRRRAAAERGDEVSAHPTVVDAYPTGANDEGLRLARFDPAVEAVARVVRGASECTAFRALTSSAGRAERCAKPRHRDR
jgi:hypothetical protein